MAGEKKKSPDHNMVLSETQGNPPCILGLLERQVLQLASILLIHTCVLQQVAPITAPKARRQGILATKAVNQIPHLLS